MQFRTSHSLARNVVSHGLTTIEVLAALSLVTIALLTLVGANRFTVRFLSDRRRESVAASLARMRLERIAGATCAASAGIDSSEGVTLRWTATANGHVAMVDEQATYLLAIGTHSELFQGSVACH